jgi:hypothetical protein
LRGAMSLARLWRQQGSQQDAVTLLAPVYGWFTEGLDTADLKDAKTLLDKLTEPRRGWSAPIPAVRGTAIKPPGPTLNIRAILGYRQRMVGWAESRRSQGTPQSPRSRIMRAV